ncbi:MAG: HupE/UreJ family protein [Steroidobacteraceae bacterium]
MIWRLLRLALVAWIAYLPQGANAHEVRPGYLELQQTAPESWSVFWKVPANGDLRLAIYPQFPTTCSPPADRVTFQNAGAYIERTSIVCQGGLAGREIVVNGLAATMTDVLVRSARTDGSVRVARLSPSNPAFMVETTPGAAAVAGTYTLLGVEHILRGIDHLLFVFALILLVRNRWMLVKTITAFTVAHSLTLAAATLGWMQVAQPPVEAVIALSILFLASELAKRDRGDAGLMVRYPWIVAFGFGLLHGIGFAGALHEVGLPAGDIPLALLAFNVGVELGQLLFVATVLVAMATLGRFLRQLPAWTNQVPSYAIGTMASFWWLQRMAPLF